MNAIKDGGLRAAACASQVGDVHASQVAGEQWSGAWQGACGRTKNEAGLVQGQGKAC
jgi:hypothetical protein